MDDDVQVSIRTPSEFRNQIMEPDYEAFMQAPSDLRLAFHAATSLFHLCDWVACAQSIPRFHLQRELEARCEYFGLISDVANAGKHLKLTISSGSMAEAGEGQLDKFGVFGYGISRGGYGHAGAYGLVPVIIVAPEGVPFASAARKVHQMWDLFFTARGSSWSGR